MKDVRIGCGLYTLTTALFILLVLKHWGELNAFISHVLAH